MTRSSITLALVLLLLNVLPFSASACNPCGQGEILYRWGEYLQKWGRPGPFLAEWRELAHVYTAAFLASGCIAGTFPSNFPLNCSAASGSKYHAANSAFNEMWKKNVAARPNAWNSSVLFWGANIPNMTADSDAFYETTKSYILTTYPDLSRSSVSQGIAWGIYVANWLWNIRSQDGFNATNNFSPSCTFAKLQAQNCTEGQWWAANPTGVNPDQIPYAQWANITLMCDDPNLFGGVNNHAQFYIPPPPPVNSKTAKDASDIIDDIGGAVNFTRTPSQFQTARFWQETSGYQYLIPVMRAIDTGFSLERAGLILSYLYVSSTDSTVMQYDNKLRYQLWRPWQRISYYNGVSPLPANDAALNASINWKPAQSTPPHPEYPAGHPMTTGSWTRALENIVPSLKNNAFPTPAVYNAISISDPNTVFTIQYTNLNEIDYDVSFARMWSGFHYPYSCIQGQRIGKIIADTCFKTLNSKFGDLTSVL